MEAIMTFLDEVYREQQLMPANINSSHYKAVKSSDKALLHVL